MELYYCHDELLLEKRIAEFQKSLESRKSKMAYVIPSTVSPPPSILSAIPIPHDIKHNQKLLNLWPQLKQQILEMRDCFYLTAYLLKALAEQLRAIEEKLRADAEKLSAGTDLAIALFGALFGADTEQVMAQFVPHLEQILACLIPYGAQLRAIIDYVSTFAEQETQQVYAFDEKVRAYMDEHKDGGCIEWYMKQTVDSFKSARKEVNGFDATWSEMRKQMIDPVKVLRDGMVIVQKCIQLVLQKQREAADCSPNYSFLEGGDGMLESTLDRVTVLMALSRL